MSETILVVEDDRRIRDLLRRGLVFEGYEVITAEDGETALRAIRDRLPDAVILDLMLPGIDGLEVCRRLRSVSNLPILVLTARDTVPDRVTGLDAGADDYMVKPFAFDELLARLRALPPSPHGDGAGRAPVRRPKLEPAHARSFAASAKSSSPPRSSISWSFSCATPTRC